MHRSTAALIPCIPLATLGAWLTTLGLEPFALSAPDAVPPRVWLAVIAGALHAAWILQACSRQAPALIASAWLVCVIAARTGLAAAGLPRALAVAVVLEGIVLALALASTRRASWAERLARWRRARHEMAMQIQMTQGLVPWARTCVRRFLSGHPDRPALAALDRVVADLADAECRMQGRMAALALPEHVRQAMIMSAQSLLAGAELAASRAAAALEHQALQEAAACGDLIRRLPELDDAERDRLARACETLMMELAHRAARAGELAALDDVQTRGAA